MFPVCDVNSIGDLSVGETFCLLCLVTDEQPGYTSMKLINDKTVLCVLQKI